MLPCLQGAAADWLNQRKQVNIMRIKMFPLCLVFAFSLTSFFESANAANREQEEGIKRMKRSAEDMIEIAGKLESCELYQKKIANPLTENLLNVEIKGIVNGKCLYIQELGYNTQLECRYSEEQRKNISRYYRSTSKQLSKGKITFKYPDPDNPLETYMNDGTCITAQAGTEEDVVIPKLLPSAVASSSYGKNFTSKNIKIEADAKHEQGVFTTYHGFDGKVYQVNVILHFIDESVSQIFQYSPVEISISKYNGGDFKVGYSGSMKEIIDSTKDKNGFNIKVNLLSQVKDVDKITNLKGKIYVDTINNDKVVVVSDIDSLLRKQRVRLDSPELNNIGIVSIEQGNLMRFGNKNNEQEFTVAIRGSSFSDIDVKIIDDGGNTLEPSLTGGETGKKINKTFSFQRPKKDMAGYKLKIIPLTTIEIPFDLSDIVIKD